MEEKKTYALTFSIDCYERDELAKMKGKELYELALAGGNETSVMTLEELSYKVNEDMISLDDSWLYFVYV